MADKIDFGMTSDGDIVLGPSQLDENLNRRTIKVGETDKEIKDMVYVVGREAWQQIIMNRLRTDAPDWYHHPAMGGNLSDLIGEPNTRETADRGVQYITACLSYNELLNPTQISVRPVPISEQEILFLLTIQMPDEDPFRIPLVFNLKTGLKEVA